MKVEVVNFGATATSMPELARRAAGLGLTGLAHPELTTDPFTTLAAAALAQQKLRLSTAVAITYARTPLAMARAALDLSELSGGAFVLGLGASVPLLAERSYGSVYQPVGPRMRDYIRALHAINDAWATGTSLDYRGRYYRVGSMDELGGGTPRPFVRTPIHLAAVNRYNLRTAGSLCDGLVVHKVCSMEYLKEVMWPEVEAGAAEAGRSLEDFEVVVYAFVATGADDEEVHRQRESVRMQIANYGVMTAYQGILSHHGFGDLTERLNHAFSEKRAHTERAALVPDELLDILCVTARHVDLPQALAERYGKATNTIRLSLPLDDFMGTVTAVLADVPQAGGYC